MCANGSARFARYCGKMCSRHISSYGGLHCASLLRIISRVIGARKLKMAAFSSRGVNHYFLVNKSGDLSYFVFFFN